MSTICLTTASQLVVLAVSQFTLSWTHSIEKTQWTETWELQGNQLVLTKASIQNHGAGMEVPEEATYNPDMHRWEWSPMIQQPGLRLTRSDFTADYTWCDTNGCRSMADILPTNTNVTDITEVYACKTR